MSKTVRLSDEAYSVLLKHKKPTESFSDVVKRFVPPPIRTFGDLKKHLENVDGPMFIDFDALRRIQSRKSRSLR